MDTRKNPTTFSLPSGEFDVELKALAADALLREHPTALVCALSDDGLIAPLPATLALRGQEALEGRAVIDSVLGVDRMTVVELWLRCLQEGSSSGRVRMLSDPSVGMTLYFFDLRRLHGVLLAVLTVNPEGAGETSQDADAGASAAPRFSTIAESANGLMLEYDEAFTHMFGFDEHELLGKQVLDHVHADDRARAVEGWMTMLSTKRVQQTRLRRMRKDGSFLWVDTTLHNFLDDPERRHVLVENIDVSAEMAAQAALEAQSELLRRLIEAMPDGLLQLDVQRRVVFRNSRLLELLRGEDTLSASAAAQDAAGERAPGEQVGEGFEDAASLGSLLDTLTTDSLSAFHSALVEVLEQGVDRDVEVDVLHPAGARRRLLMTLRVLLRADGEVSGAIASVLDVTDSARARQELERRATFDALTHCHNRSSILTALERELERTDYDTHHATCILYVDLDDFKSVNDTLGHAAGDELLACAAERLKATSRSEDDVGRLGGDEFLVLVRNLPACESGLELAQRVGEALHDTVELSAGPVALRASIGVACCKGEQITAAALIERADAAMYASKSQGLGAPVFAGHA